MGWRGLNPNLMSALAPFALVEVGAEFGAELDNVSFKLKVINACVFTMLLC